MRLSRKIMILALVCLLGLVAVSCDGSVGIKGNKAAMLVIGMDYHNSLVAPSLTGTINDAVEMAAAVNAVMDAKKVPFELHMMKQEGYDVLLEATIESTSHFREICDDVMNGIKATLEPSDPVHIDMPENNGERGVIRAQVKDLDVARALKVELEERYSGGSGSVKVDYASLRDSSTYPSRENILKTVRSLKLDKNDLLIVYYTGHGDIYDVILPNSLSDILQKYADEGMITAEQKSYVMGYPQVFDENSIVNAMQKAHIEESVSFSITTDIHTAILAEKHVDGALITAPTERDPFYGQLNMRDFFDELQEIGCKCVVITDACYSGFLSEDSYQGSSFMGSFASFMNDLEYPSVAALSASAPDETSKVTVVRTEEGTFQRHSAFTIEVLERLKWVHTDKKFTYLRLPDYRIGEHGGLLESKAIYEVHGYSGGVPERTTASALFDDIMSEWADNNNSQTPQRNQTVYDIVIIP